MIPHPLSILIILLTAALIFLLLRLRTAVKEQKRLQAALDLHKENDRLKDDFLANTSHELRTPLNGIIGISDSLLDGVRGDLSPFLRENMLLVSSSAKRLLRFVNDIMLFATLKKRQMILETEPADLHQVTEKILSLSKGLIGNKDLTLINAVPPDLPMALADTARLEQVLTNLVGNAVKFTTRGHVEIWTRIPADGFLEVRVSDTGIGIAENRLEKVFDAFEHESHENLTFEGTGIGLSITKQIVELHGGTVRAESEQGAGHGQGAVFIFTLPVAEVPAEKIPQSPNRITPEISAYRIPASERRLRDTGPPQGVTERRRLIRVLAVDDEPANLQVISNYLGRLNIAVIRAFNGMEALEIIRKDLKPDCVLLDVMMPRMNGFTVCKKIRETYTAAEMPVIMLTARYQTDDLVRGFQAGASDYLSKPFVKDELLARIKTHTDLIKTVDRLINTTADKEAMNRELEVAQGIQMSVLPADFFADRPEFDLFAMMEPVRMVGGDLYDFFFPHEHRLCFVIGDVSDKGVAAALFMVMVKTLIKALADNPAYHDPVRLLDELNRILNRDNPRNMFVTLITGFLDMKTGQISYANAGHNPPLFLDSSGNSLFLREKSGPFAGPFPYPDYETLHHRLKPGDTLFLYTDGVTEALNPETEAFGEERLMATAGHSRTEPVEKIIADVAAAVKKHAGQQTQSDDITMLVLRYIG